MNSDDVWFSHRERIFQIKDGKVEWTDETKIRNWEYVPGVMDSPLILGSKTRKEIDAEFDRGQANET